jgi:hypothetical protein
MNKVAGMYHKGNTNPTVIARELGMKRAEVLTFIEEWKDIAKNDVNIREQAAETLQGSLQHYDMLIKEGWNLLQQSDDAGDLKNKATVIKAIADMSSKKVEMLQKAGLYDDASLGDELAEMEEKQQILVGILREVTADCERCKFEVARRLTKVTGKVESVSPSVVIDGEVTNPAT